MDGRHGGGRGRWRAAALPAIAALVLAVVFPARAVEVPAPCAGADGKRPVIEAGREGDVKALFAPHRAGEAIAGAAPGFVLRSLAVLGQDVDAKLEGPGGVTATLRLRPRVCRPDDTRGTASFVFDLPEGEPPEARAALDLLRSAVRANDGGAFHRAFAEPGGPGHHAPAPGVPALRRPVDPAALFALPFHETQGALGLTLLLALLSLAIVAPGVARASGLAGPGAAGTWLALLALLAAALAVRAAAGPTFLREAFPLPDAHYLLDPIEWSAPLASYPPGQAIVVHFLMPLLPSNPYDAWFAANLLFGTLAVFAAWLLGSALTGRKETAFVLAALLAFWPQHVRFSASESAHVGLVLFATLAFALAAFAARDGKLTTFLAAAGATAAALVMRPEAALLAPFVAALALVHGPGVRRRLLSPPRIAAVGGLVWLLAPSLLTTLADDSARQFSPAGGGPEAPGLASLLDLARILVVPSADNAFFDPATAPLWLFPLAIWGAVAGVRRCPRGAALVFAAASLALLLFYIRMGRAITVFAYGRYHLTILPAVAALAALGLEDALRRVPRLAASPGRLAAAAAAVAALGLALWWPAVKAVPMDWQRELHWLVDLGKRDPPLVPPGTRVVLPDNRRRFRDLTPRDRIEAITAGREPRRAAVSVEEALARLHVDSPDPPAVYVEGLFCWLAVGPGEAFEPQCRAMHEAFELEEIDRISISEPPFLVAYEATRPAPVLTPAVYRVGKRRLPPEDALRLLPAPWPEGASPPAGFDAMGSPTDPDTFPTDPPLP